MDLVWAYLVCRYWRGIAWTFAWMFAFWAPDLIPIPVIGWFAPPLLFWAAVSSRRRRLDRQTLNTAAAAHCVFLQEIADTGRADLAVKRATTSDVTAPH